MLSATGKTMMIIFVVSVVRISLELPSVLKERQGVVLVLPLGAVLPGGCLPLRLDPGDTDDLHQGSSAGITITPAFDFWLVPQIG